MTGDTDTPRFAEATIRIDRLPATGRELKLSLGAEEREALAGFLELTAIERLHVEMTATPFRGGIRVLGWIRAAIVQPSVVSLDPVRQEIDEPIERVFLPGAQGPHPATAGQEVFIDLEGDDLPDPLEGPEADLSDLVIETLALAIDPYPRSEGESIENLEIPADGDDEASPFRALKSLKPPPDEA